MPEFTVDVAFDVYCSCGEGLCQQSTAEDYRRGYGGGGRRVVVEPCQKCAEKARSEGYDAGYDAGYGEATE